MMRRNIIFDEPVDVRTVGITREIVEHDKTLELVNKIVVGVGG